MAGLGGCFGYAMGAINWDVTFIGTIFGGHVRAVFSLVTVIFIVCVMATVTSFREVPLDILTQEGGTEVKVDDGTAYSQVEEDNDIGHTPRTYGALEDALSKNQTEPHQQQNQPTVQNGYVNYGYDEETQHSAETSFAKKNQEQRALTDGLAPVVDAEVNMEPASLNEYLMSIVYMPHSMRILCLTNLFCWMAHVCYSLYFTDFVGEAVFGGDPKGPDDSDVRERYEEGVRFGCWGMSMYSLSCSCYSLIIDRLIKRFRAKRVYVGGQLVYCIGMFLMALTRHRVGVILFSWTAGVMYSTLFTMPYLLVAHYHASDTFETTSEGEPKMENNVRGLGTDVAIVSSMVFMAQFILSMMMGHIVHYSGTTTAVVCVASFLSFCGAITATQVMYLDL